MKNIGFIGYGSMNSMLIGGLLRTRKLSPDLLYISTRTPSKVQVLADRYPEIQVMDDNEYLVGECEVIIVGVKPLDVLPLIAEIRTRIRPGAHLISIAACVRIHELESVFGGMISRIIPSLCGEHIAGVTLCCHNDHVDHEHAGFVEDLFGSISRVIRVDEDQFETATDLMGCAPAIFSTMLNEFAKAGCRKSSLDPGTAYEMALKAFIGTGLLLGNMTPEEIIPRVATPGGITEEGLQILREGLPSLFDDLFSRTEEKNNLLIKMIREGNKY